MSGVLLLAFAALGALVVGVVVAGVRQPIRYSYLFFVLGLLTGDLAWWNLVWSGAVTAVLIRAGALDTDVGVAGLALVIAVWIGLGFLQVQQSRARAVLGRALDVRLGRPNPLAVLRPWQPPRSGVAVEHHRYGDDPRQVLEILRPTGRAGAAVIGRRCGDGRRRRLP